MSESARHLEVITASATTEGLDDLFASATQCEAVAADCVALQINCEADATHCEYSIIEASQMLNVSPSTVYRRIKSGKYQTLTDSSGAVKVLLPRTATQRESDATQCEADATQCESNATQCESNATHREASDNDGVLAKALLEMSQKLEAANYRIGWLESQMQEREQQIKLLTDSQHRPGWLMRFKNWIARQ